MLVRKNNFRSTTGDPFDQGFSKLRGVLGLMIPQHLGALSVTSEKKKNLIFVLITILKIQALEVKALSKLKLESV